MIKTLQEENKKELIEKVIDLIGITSVSLGHRTDADTIFTLAQIFAEDLQKENRFKRLTFNQVKDAFHIGLRFSKFDPYINIRTFYRFLISHKKTIDSAYYDVHTLGKKPEQVPYYQPPKKLLK
tara:strand:- start:2 stop:373 length:372 start_codon:yes stop_codon:yes gene_type:complete